MENLKECREIVNQLEAMYTPAYSLEGDELFLTLLKEDIDLFRSERHQFPGKVLFNIAESGEVIYEGISESIPKDFTGMSIVLNPEPTDVSKLLKEQMETIKHLQTINIDTPVQEKRALREKLETFSQQIKELGKEIADCTVKADLIEAVRSQMVTSPAHIDIKKSQLLDKLLRD